MSRVSTPPPAALPCPPPRPPQMSVRRKLNAMPVVFAGKSVLLIDDSIVRGTTMSQIVDMVRNAGAEKVRRGAEGRRGGGEEGMEGVCGRAACRACHTSRAAAARRAPARQPCAGQPCGPASLPATPSPLPASPAAASLPIACIQVYLASASPPVRYPNVYGVDMPTRRCLPPHAPFCGLCVQTPPASRPASQLGLAGTSSQPVCPRISPLLSHLDMTCLPHTT